MNEMYILVRRGADEDKSMTVAVGDTCWRSKWAADEAAGNDLMRHGGTTRQYADEYVALLAGQPVGSIVLDVRTGLNYRILIVDFTSNRQPVTPGLRVLDYDRQEGTVSRAQFMDDGMMSPGGEHFDHWYHVTPDGETGGYSKRFDGSRMQAVRS